MDTLQLTSTIFIKIDGYELPPAIKSSIIEVEVDQHAHLPGMFIIRVYDPRLDMLDHSNLDLGQLVEISSITPENQYVSMISGEITAIEPVFGRNGAAEIVIRGYDHSHRLYRQIRSRTFLNIKDSDLAEKIAREWNLKPEVDTTITVYDHVYQHNQSDLEFLLQRAWRIGYECFVTKDTLYFRKPRGIGNASVSVRWGDDLLAFYPRLTVAEQVDEVVVRGWDPEDQKPIVGRASEGGLFARVKESNKKVLWTERFGQGKIVIVDQSVNTQAEADILAAARMDELSGTFIRAEGIAFRRPDIRAGEPIRLEGVGNRFTGTYLVTTARHIYNMEEGLETTFNIQGTRTGLMAEEMNSMDWVNRWYGVVTAMVTNNNDPQGLGRVKIRFPWLDDLGESSWVRVLSPEPGVLVPPSVNDEVLVSFEHGNFDRPLVLGTLFSSNNFPEDMSNASENGQTVMRSWRSAGGHAINMFDRTNDKRMEIVTGSGHTISMDDTKKTVTITSASGHTIVLDDRKRSVRIESAGNLDIESAGNLNLTAKGQVNVRGSRINLN